VVPQTRFNTNGNQQITIWQISRHINKTAKAYSRPEVFSNNPVYIMRAIKKLPGLKGSQ
jgi:hypothetical protein